MNIHLRKFSYFNYDNEKNYNPAHAPYFHWSDTR